MVCHEVAGTACRQRRVAAVVTALIAGLAMAASGCTHKTAASPPPAPAGNGTTQTTPAGTAGAAAGTWTGTWVRTAPVGGGGTLTFTLQQQGSALSGTLDDVGSVCFTTTTVSGTIEGSKVDLHANAAGATGEWTGTITGDTIKGTLTATCAPGTGTGTWQVNRS